MIFIHAFDGKTRWIFVFSTLKLRYLSISRMLELWEFFFCVPKVIGNEDTSLEKDDINVIFSL